MMITYYIHNNLCNKALYIVHIDFKVNEPSQN